jgi:ABC-type methionine transport system ATPase subunit
MKTIFLMQPRQSGKTTKAIYEFLKDPTNSLFVTHNTQTVKYICDKIHKNNENIISSNQFVKHVFGRRPKNIILDEYMLFNNTYEIYKTIKSVQTDNVYIFTTSNKSYDKNLFDFVKKYKQTMAYNDLLLKYGNNLTDYIKKQIYELYYNFLTDNETLLIDFDFSSSIKDMSHLINIIGKERYDIEINNYYLF